MERRNLSDKSILSLDGMRRLSSNFKCRRKWKECGEQGEEKRSHEHEHVDGMKDSLLEPRCVCARCDVLTHKKKRNSACSRSDNVEVSESGHVVIGVRIVQCHHAIMDSCEHVVFVSASCIVTTHSWPILNFPLLVPISSWSQYQLVTCSQFQIVVRLYDLIVTFSL